MRRRRLSLEAALAREILYQGYTASRQSGFRPYNPARSISRATTMKYIMSAIWVLVMAGYAFTLRIARTWSPLGMVLMYFGWGGTLIVSNLLPAASAVQGSSYMRDALYILPVEEEELRAKFARAFISLVDYPLIAVIVGSIIASAVVGSPYPAIGALFGSEVAVIVIELTILAFSSGPRSQARLMASRALSAFLPLIFIAFLVSPMYMSSIGSSAPPFLSFLPILSGAYATSPVGIASTAAWLALLGYYAYRELPHASLRILYAGAPGAIVRRVRAGWRIVRSRTLAILRADLQMAFRSVMVSALMGPLIIFIIFLVESYSVPAGALAATASVYGIEVAYLTIFVPYSLYAIEVRGAAAMRSLPVTKVSLALPKVLLLAVVYYAFEGTLAVAVWARGISPAYVVPLLAGVLAPASSVPAAGIMFERTLREGGSLSTLQAILYLLLVSLLVGIPYGAYYAASILLRSEIPGVVAMVVMGAVEFSMLMYALHRYDR